MRPVSKRRIARIVFITAMSLLGIKLVGAAEPRFLYKMYCNSISKVDMTTGKEVEDIELSQRTKLVPAESPRTAFCDLNTLMYDTKIRQVQVMVSDRGRQAYLWIAFSVPDFKVVAHRWLKGRFEEGSYPALVRGASGSVLADLEQGYMKLTAAGVLRAEADGNAGSLLAHDHHVRVPGMQTGSHEGWLDLSQYHGEDLQPYSAYGQGKLLLSEPLTQTGDKALFSVTGAGGERLASVDASSRKITLFDISPGQMTQTSDGRYLLVQEYGTTGGNGYGKVWLLDLEKGTIVKTYDDDRVKNSAFLAFAPTGQLVFQGFVENTGVTFAETTPENAFFADK